MRTWLAQFAVHEVEFALEGTTGWRFVVEEIERAGYRAHLADPGGDGGQAGPQAAREDLWGALTRFCLGAER